MNTTATSQQAWDDLAATVIAQDHQDAALLRLRLQLHAPARPKTFCTAHVTGNAGWRVANCTREHGHDGPHVDCHEARVWGEDR